MKCPNCGHEHHNEFITKCTNCNHELDEDTYLNLIINEYKEKYSANYLNQSASKIDYININEDEVPFELYEKYTNSEISPESLVIDYYKQKGYYSFFAENDYWTLLFFLIYFGFVKNFVG